MLDCKGTDCGGPAGVGWFWMVWQGDVASIPKESREERKLAAKAGDRDVFLLGSGMIEAVCCGG